MAKNRDILLVQQREIERNLQQRYIQRKLHGGKEDNDLIKVIMGPRRAGKSFFTTHLIEEFGRFGYVNFDDEGLTQLEDYDGLVAALDSVYDNPEYLLLDEIQNLPKWELFVNRLQRQGYRLFITGSNAHLLSSELATHLTGRHQKIVLFPFSFSEYLKISHIEQTEAEKTEAFWKYLETGGYPEPLVKDIDRREYLTTLFDSTLYKDIVTRHQVRSQQSMADLAKYLMSNVAQEYSYNTLADVTRVKSPKTIEKYLRYLEEAFLFFPVNRFSFKVREQTKSPRKIYCTDNGLVTSTAFRFSSDRGKLCENLIAITLRKQQLMGNLEFYIWKGPRQEEVDFVIKKGPKMVQLIQVCTNIKKQKTKNREVRSLVKASDKLNCDNLLVLTGNTEGEENVSWYGHEGKVKFQPMWKWLLNSK